MTSVHACLPSRCSKQMPSGFHRELYTKNTNFKPFDYL